MEMCTYCPLLKQCALNALHAGDSLDMVHKQPATGVIQAGVWCNGDQDTANQLAAIAGVDTPQIGPHARFTPPDNCRGCGKPMSTRIKGMPLTKDELTHAAHGYCRICDAKRRRQKDWQSTQPKNTTIFTWREKRHDRNTGPGRKHHRTHPNSRPHRDVPRPGPNRKGVQESLF